MHGQFTLELLKKIAERANEYGELLEVFLLSGPGAATPRIRKRRGELKWRIASRENREQIREKQRKIKRRFYSLIQWLEKDGLVTRRGKRKICITKQGFAYLKRLEARKEREIIRTYPTERSTTLIMVAFDIPEQEKEKRVWLRGVLRELGFSLLQKSLWIGKIKIPEELLEDISRRGLGNRVEIFEITKQGSLREIL
ncbi:MAG: hypothetical protein FJY98_04380 [Candidatus Liptonbacteria bacterium]|nr:hypothetical protein [Candidatus Liptonbacteria bacterium]